MPKSHKGKGKEVAREDVKPYARTSGSVKTERSQSQPEAPHRNNHSPHPTKAASQPTASGNSKKHKKKRRRRTEEGTPAVMNGHTGDDADVNGAHAEPNGSGSPVRAVERVKPDPDAHEAVRRRMFGPEANGVDPAERQRKRDAEKDLRKKVDSEVKDLKKKVASMTKAEEEAERIAAQLRARIAELEQTVATQQADMTKTKDEIEVKEKVSCSATRIS
jgi:hypothetical protein